MPTRIVREGINSSQRINALTFMAELFYRRLMTVADDYGRFYASPVTLRGACWPTCPEKVTEEQVASWLSECLSGDSPLISIYESKGCDYLQIDNFGQQTRGKSKFPEPNGFKCLAIDNQVISGCLENAQPSRSRSRSRITNTESKISSSPAIEEDFKLEPVEQTPKPEKKVDAIKVWFEETFWPLYPRKIGKQESLAAARKSLPGHKPSEVLGGLHAQLPKFLRLIADGKVESVPHASTWLRGQRWKDEPEVPLPARITSVPDRIARRNEVNILTKMMGD